MYPHKLPRVVGGAFVEVGDTAVEEEAVALAERICLVAYGDFASAADYCGDEERVKVMSLSCGSVLSLETARFLYIEKSIFCGRAGRTDKTSGQLVPESAGSVYIHNILLDQNIFISISSTAAAAAPIIISFFLLAL